jgi:peptidoglycan/xylan/chitin deacetylase (PgdA/CDA1 family)
MLPYLAAAAGLVFAGYHTMGPRSQLYGRTFVSASRESRRLALTFDDGPSDPWTLRVLEVLARHNVRATFFMIGSHVEQCPEIARAVAKAGHVIGNHTQTHPLLIFKSIERIAAEVNACSKALGKAVGEHTRLFRPPYGGRQPWVLREVRRQGYSPVMWSVAGYDWQTQAAEKIEREVHRRVRGGDVILLHDGAPQPRTTANRAGTVEAVARIIPGLQAEGYEFVTVPELMRHA